MKPELIKHLICIHCKNSLKLTVFKEDSEVIDGILICKKCGEKYLIIEGVPRMLPKELAKEMIKTAKGFGYEWKEFSEIHQEYESQFLDWIHPVKKEFFKNKLVLDAGCGTGRHAYFAEKYGATVIGIDLSEAVDVAYKNTKNLKNTHIVQADIYNLPFSEEYFDYVYSIGVLHHLPRPQDGFNALVKHTSKKGAISAWVYGRENNTLLKIADPIRKFLFSHLPLQVNYLLAHIFVISMFPVMKTYNFIDRSTRNEKLKKMLPQFNFLVYLSKLNFKIVHSIIFDQILAPIANYYTKEEFEKWFKDAKLKNIVISWRNKNSWRGFAEK